MALLIEGAERTFLSRTIAKIFPTFLDGEISEIPWRLTELSSKEISIAPKLPVVTPDRGQFISGEDGMPDFFRSGSSCGRGANSRGRSDGRGWGGGCA